MKSLMGESSMLKKVIAISSIVSVLLALTSCGGGGTWGRFTSPYITVDNFVSNLNLYGSGGSYVLKYEYETFRSTMPGQDQWFVIWDGEYNHHKAVNLDYLRAMIYYDFYSNDYAVAREFRSREDININNGNLTGDRYGDDYEIVDWVGGYYRGRTTGFNYEDEDESNDVAMIAGEKQQIAYFEKAAHLSFAYQISIQSSLTLVSLGEKLKEIKRNGNGALTTEDKQYLLQGLEQVTGVRYQDVIQAGRDHEKQASIIEKVAKKVGTTSQALKEKLLPEMFSIHL
jgi:hypothetical protein